MNPKNTPANAPNPRTLQIMLGINGVLFVFMLILLITQHDKWISGIAAGITGLAALGCWFQLSQLKLRQEDGEPLAEE